MNRTEDAFNELDENLNLDPQERAAAIALHNTIHALLLAQGLIVDAFLQGSFARKTMKKPLHDIDKVVILPASRWDEFNHGGGPDAAMDLIEGVLRSRFPRSTFERSRHALKMELNDEDFSFDIVPAFDTDTDDVLIARREGDGRQGGSWERSNTRQLIRAVAERNGQCGGIFVHQVRMVKQFAADVVPGLHSESFAFMAIEAEMGHMDACLAVAERAVAALGGHYSDPTGADLISKRLPPEERAAARQHFSGVEQRLREAYRLAEAGDDDRALDVLHEVFGEAFPQGAEQSIEEAFSRSFHTGSVTSSGTVSGTAEARQKSTANRAWCER